jgi:anti-sigma factor RsiW
MDCARTDELLQQAVAGTLSTADRQAWLAHAATCPACAARRDELWFAELTSPAQPEVERLSEEQVARLLAIADEPISAVELALGEPLRIAVPTMALAAVVIGLCLLRLGPALRADSDSGDRPLWPPLARAQQSLPEGLEW